jgi:hypothetical protein
VTVQSNIAAVRAQVHQRAERLVDETGKRLVEETQARAPRSTVDDPDHVHLADSYEWFQHDETAGEMTSDVEYAGYQEFGTVFQHGTPHVAPAAVAVTPEFEDGLGHLFDG